MCDVANTPMLSLSCVKSTHPGPRPCPPRHPRGEPAARCSGDMHAPGERRRGRRRGRRPTGFGTELPARAPARRIAHLLALRSATGSSECRRLGLEARSRGVGEGERQTNRRSLPATPMAPAVPEVPARGSLALCPERGGSGRGHF